MSTGRLLPQPEPAAWPPLMPNVILESWSDQGKNF
jgi:hypothetical protein